MRKARAREGMRGTIVKISQSLSTAAVLICLFSELTAAGQTSKSDQLAGAAIKAFEAGDFSQAEKSLLAALRISPRNPHYTMALGQVYLSSGRPKSAIPLLQRALRTFPGDFDVRHALAQAYQNIGDDLNALQTLNGDLPPEPQGSVWTFLRGFSLFRLGHLESAETTFNRLLRVPKMEGPANFFLGNCHFSRNHFERAVAYYQKAISIGNVPENKALNVYYYNYALALYHLQDYENAAAAFRNSIGLYSRDPLPWLFLGRCEMELGHFEEAIKSLESPININPKFSPPYYQLAKLHMKHGSPHKAKELFAKVAEIKKNELEQEHRLPYQLKLPVQE